MPLSGTISANLISAGLHRGGLGRSRSSALRGASGQGSLLKGARRVSGTTISAGLFDGLASIFGGSKKEGKNDDVLKWARTAAKGCPLAPATAPEGLEIATFAGGCFWGLELAYQRVEGVTRTSVGYTGGPETNPTYNSVCAGRTGHAEAVQVYYDPQRCTYERLLDEFFEKVDPTTLNRQGNDRGTQYRSAIYYHTPAQKEVAEKVIARVNEQLQSNTFRPVWGKEVVSKLQPAGDYYIAEKYHQQYLSRGGRFGLAQSADKGCQDKIRCYG